MSKSNNYSSIFSKRRKSLLIGRVESKIHKITQKFKFTNKFFFIFRDLNHFKKNIYLTKLSIVL